MSEADVITIARTAVYTTLVIASPPLIVAIVVGLIIALFQAVTQINEITLTFVPKIVAVFVTVAVAAPFMYQTLSTFVELLIDRIALGDLGTLP